MVWEHSVSSLYSIHGLTIQFHVRPILVHVFVNSLPVDVVSIASLSVHPLCNVIPNDDDKYIAIRRKDKNFKNVKKVSRILL